jgi:tRNA pseudouridine55 synthase
MSSGGSLFGILNVNKHAGVTSRDVVNTVQRLVRPAKCGHAGTLDPMATGVLLICIGPATRLVHLLQEAPKTYITEFTLGQRSDTDDATGRIETFPGEFTQPSAEDLSSLLKTMTGLVQQVPPDYSAVHVNGRRAYDMARRGQNVQLSARPVEIFSIRLVHYEWPHLILEIVCGSGTYIRSIARDLGEQLGCGALMSRLERTRIGSYSVKSGISSEQLTKETIQQHLHSPVAATAHLERYLCADAEILAIVQGKRILVDHERIVRPVDGNAEVNSVALLSNDGSELLAMAEWVPDRTALQPRIVFHQQAGH